MGGRGLLWRIAGGGPVEEVESILAHVRALLNTRIGESPSAPSLGVVDFTDIARVFPGGVQDLAASMRDALLANEPRLHAVAVSPLPTEGSLVLRFEITAQLAGRENRPLSMTTTVRPGGRVEVGD